MAAASSALAAAPYRRTARPLCVADVAMWYGEHSGGIRTYLDEKAHFAAGHPELIEHHVFVPSSVRSVRVRTSNGYRIPLGASGLLPLLAACKPDVVLMHDPFWTPHHVAQLTRSIGAKLVFVHHSSAAMQSAALKGPRRLYLRGFRSWMHHAYQAADAVMSAVPTGPDAGRGTDLPLRLGLHPAFRPHVGVAERDHVLCVGRIAREKGVYELLEAAALSEEPWTLRMVGTGPAQPNVLKRAERLGIAERLELRPFVTDRAELARAYAEASVVVMPGPFETFGLVALEAAASGARVVACRSAPSAQVMAHSPMVRTFPMEDPVAMLDAIERLRATPRDPRAAARVASELTWERAFTAELRDLRELIG